MNRSYAIRTCIAILAAVLTIISGHSYRSYAVDWDGGGIDTVYRMDVKAQRIYGDAAETTLDVDDDRKWNVLYNETLDLKLNHKTDGGLSVTGGVSFRHTDDKILMTRNKHFDIPSGNLKVSGERWFLDLGKISATFTNHIFQNSFLGIKGEYSNPAGSKLMLLGGVNRDSTVDRYVRAFGGVRLYVIADPRLKLGASYVHTEITKLYYDSDETAYRNDVFSVDGTLSFHNERLVLDGEMAMSFYLDDMRNPRSETVRDTALWANFYFEPLRNELGIMLRGEYVEPGFVSTMGTSVIMRKMAAVAFGYQPSDRWLCMSYYRLYRTGPADAPSDSYSVYHTDFGLVIQCEIPHFIDPDSDFTAMLDIYYHDESDTNDPKSVNKETLTLILTAGYDLEHTDYEVIYTYEQILNHLSDGIDSETHDVNCSWSYKNTAFGLDYKIGCGMNMEYKTRLWPNSTNTVNDFELGASFGGEVVFRRLYPREMTLEIECSGTVWDYGEKANVRDGEMVLRLTKVLVKRRDLTASIALEYTANHTWTSDGSGRYGEKIGMMSFNMEF